MGNLNFTLPLYLHTLPGYSLKADTYSSTLNVLTQYKILYQYRRCRYLLARRYAVRHGGGSAERHADGHQQLYSHNRAPNLNFGSAPLVANFNDLAQNISVTCTKGSSYTVGFSNDAHAVGTVRNMASAVAIRATSDGLTRMFNYVARVVKTRNTPPAGVYTDSVVIDLSF